MIVTPLLNRISRNLILSLFLAFPLLASAQAQLKINELMPKNVSFLMDKSYITQIEKKFDADYVLLSTTNLSNTWVQSNVWANTYNYSMWVEVYNTSTSPKTLSDYFFTDDLSKPTKWRPLSINGAVAGNGFSVLFFEREDEDAYSSYVRPASSRDLYLLNRQGHASFKLDPEGGKLYLLNSATTVIDSVVYPAQYRNSSYGRVTDGTGQWALFEQPSPGTSNNGKLWGTQTCPSPTFTHKNGFYTLTFNLGFVMPAVGDTIYYTLDGSEPTRVISPACKRYVPNTTFKLYTGVSKIRAKTFSWGKISSEIVTNTYFIGQRSFNNLPVVSIVTDDKNINDNVIGIYTNGTNGLPGRGQDVPKNSNQDWDRPVNFEFFDKTGTPQVNQEVDIKILGGWSRHFSSTLKSIAISPKDKFGIDMLNYDFFAASKPGHKYKDIQIRNSGNDAGGSRMDDGLILSLSAHRMDVDYLAYEPAVLFINGNYIGLQNIRERSNADFLFSNYGYAKDDVEIIEAIGPILETKNDMRTDPAFNRLVQFLKTNDLSDPAIYRQVCDSIDVDEFINYMIPQIYVANTDWPDNNVKMWRKKNGGKWRWILYDTDFGFENASHNTVMFALGENGGSASSNGPLAEWSYIVFKRLCTSPQFVDKLVDRFAIHMTTTYKPSRVNYIIDSLANRIDEEYPTVKNYLNGWKSFASDRNATVMSHIANRFLRNPDTQVVPAVDTLDIDANVNGASYTLNNAPIMDKKVRIGYFKGRTISLKANRVSGYRFDHWSFSSDAPILPKNSEWKYYYYTNMPLKAGVPSVDWNKTDYVDTDWSSGSGAFGYLAEPIVTRLDYGPDSDNRYLTAYFRKIITINNLNQKDDFVFNLDVGDGAIVYVNGVEVQRKNMNAGGGDTLYFVPAVRAGVFLYSFKVSKSFFKEGENLIAVEVHKSSPSRIRMRFDMNLTYKYEAVSTEPVYTMQFSESLLVRASYVPYTEPPIEKNIVINEVVSSNQEVMDEFGVKEDYIELYNKGTEPVDIGGWWLTDTPSNKLFHQLPTNSTSVTTIQPGGRLILWADDEANQGVQHLGFKLGKDGETLMLSKVLDDNSVVIMDSVSFPALGTQSYSRVPDGASTWAIQGLTFNAPNSPTDVPGIETSLIKLYPTQVTESFTVLNADGRMVSVIDLTGKVLKRELCTSNEMTVLTGDLNRGMYIVTVGDKTFKVIRR